MTRTDVMASSRPLTPGTTPTRSGSARLARRLAVIPATLLAIALIGPGTALAAEGTSGYGSEPPKTTTTTTTTPTTTPTTETSPTGTTSPSKETSEPTKSEEPTSTSSPEKEKAKASTLPFTGFDLRWSLGIGLVLMVSGLSIVAVQRRQRRHGGS
jgi:hypothetical protein